MPFRYHRAILLHFHCILTSHRCCFDYFNPSFLLTFRNAWLNFDSAA